MTLVLVHGLAGSPRWWRPVVPLLRDRDVRMLAPDELALLEEPVDLVGHSLGGLACASLAAARPELVRSLVLAAPVGAGDRALLSQHGLGLARTLATARADVLRVVVPDALRWGPRLVGGAWRAVSGRFDGEITAPTLLLWGRRDALVPVELAQEWLRVVPHARLAVIEDAAHVPMVETPSAFADLVNEFLDDSGMRPVDGVRRTGNDDEPPAREE